MTGQILVQQTDRDTSRYFFQVQDDSGSIVINEDGKVVALMHGRGTQRRHHYRRDGALEVIRKLVGRNLQGRADLPPSRRLMGQKVLCLMAEDLAALEQGTNVCEGAIPFPGPFYSAVRASELWRSPVIFHAISGETFHVLAQHGEVVRRVAPSESICVCSL